ncbi:MAG: hypothetical protein ACE3JU_11615 [Paenibacillus sp.]|uniref:hypothetical protein n=1 Tax=Paenibacillus sp. TaxID=58172 RepID=UPI003B7A9E4C
MFNVKATACVMCEVSPHQLGDNIIGTSRDSREHQEHLRRWHWYSKELEKEKGKEFPVKKQCTGLQKEIKARELWFDLRQSKPLDNVLFREDFLNVSAAEIWKPDILHTIYQGVLKHLLGWLKKFLEHYERYAQFNQVWLRISAFADIPEHRNTIGSNI